MATNSRFLRLIHALQNKYRQQVRDALEEQINTFIADGTVPTKPIARVLRKIYEDGGVANALYVRKQVKRQLRKGMEDASDRIVWMINEYYRQNLLSQAVQPITATTRKQIEQVLQEANANGWGADKTASMLRNSDITKVRAELIVRTETMRAANAGAMIGAIDMGVLVNKQWISTQDIRTRRIPRNQYDHLHMKGKTVGFAEDFIIPSTKTIDAMQYPGDPNGSAGNVCNCRCTVAFIPVRDAQGRPIPIGNTLPNDAPQRQYGNPQGMSISNVFVELLSRVSTMVITQAVIDELIGEIEV